MTRVEGVWAIQAPDGLDQRHGQQIMRRKAKEMRKRLGTRHRELMDGLDAIVWEADPDTLRFTFVSQGAGRVLGYPPARWQNEPGFLQNHLHPEDRDETLRPLQDASQPGHSRVLEYRMMASDGS
ncbi:MAG TPA: PAS domain-containing protein, partial [Anaerolineae bacterium]|nr:PAS domain-containing protein [Anaerolineae bacterium]